MTRWIKDVTRSARRRISQPPLELDELELDEPARTDEGELLLEEPDLCEEPFPASDYHEAIARARFSFGRWRV